MVMEVSRVIEDPQLSQLPKVNGTKSLVEKIKSDPELWAEIHTAAIRTIDELRLRLNLHD